jgi:hypothetical protein
MSNLTDTIASESSPMDAEYAIGILAQNGIEAFKECLETFAAPSVVCAILKLVK